MRTEARDDCRGEMDVATTDVRRAEVSNEAEGASAREEGGKSRTILGRVKVDRVGGVIRVATAEGVDVVHNVIAEGEVDGEMKGSRSGGHKAGLVGGGLDSVEAEESATHGLEERLSREEPNARDVVSLALAGRGVRLAKGLRAVAAEDSLVVQRRREEVRQDQEAGGLKARPERAELKKGPWAPRWRVGRGEISEGPPCGGGKASEGRTGCEGVEGDKGKMTEVVEDEAGELAMHKEAEDRRRAVDKVSPGGNEIRVDAEEVGAGGDAADGGGSMEAHGVAIAARNGKGSTEAVEAG